MSITRLTAALAAIVITAAPSTAAAKPPVVKRSIGGPGTVVPRSFAGLSIEYTSAADYFGTPEKPNAAFIELLKTLGAGGVGAPAIHLGGNSADGAWWNPDGLTRPAGVETDLTPAFLAALRPVSERAKSPLVVGGNLGIADAGNAVSFVRAAVAALPPGAIESYEIGNEPDLYDRGITFNVGNLTLTRPQRRPIGYGVPQYLAEADAYIAALNSNRTAGWPALAVGGFARHSWTVQAPPILDHFAKAVGFFQLHAYPLNRCRASRVPARRWRRTLLGDVGSLPVARAARLVRSIRSRGVAVRQSELNSATCGGAQGVSDTFASALWGADALFGLAEAGVVGVNLHTWTGAWYAPIDFNAGVVRVRPLLYGMLLFDRAVPNDARLLRVAQRRTDRVKVWATRDSKSTVRVVVINKDPRRARIVRLKVPGKRRAGTLERLLARSVASRTGVTFGSRSFERGGFDGRLHGSTRRERVVKRHGRFGFRLRAASAALLTVRAPRP